MRRVLLLYTQHDRTPLTTTQQQMRGHSLFEVLLAELDKHNAQKHP